MIIEVNGSKISIHRFIATTLFRMDKLRKNDHIHQAIETNVCMYACQMVLAELKRISNQAA